MAQRVLLIGTGFGARVVAGCYRDAGMAVEVITPRDEVAVRAACAAGVDLVSIHAPPFLHKRFVDSAIDHGLPVLCDKPFGTSVDEARAMLARAEAAGVLNFVNFEFRHDPVRLALKRLIEEGAVGHVQHVHWLATFAGSRLPLRPWGWLFDRSLGGGWIGAFGSHVFDGLRWMLGEGEVRDGSVRTAIAERPDGEGVMHACTAEDSFTARLSFASGATALVDTTFAGHAHRPERITVFGDDGMIEVTGTTEIRVWNAKGEQVHRFEPFDGDPHLPSMRPWARAVATALAEDRQIAPSFRDGLACAELIGQLRERAE